MRLTNCKIPFSNGIAKTEFTDCFGNILEQSIKSNLKISHLQFERKIFDSHENFLGFLMKEYEKLGAINIFGEIYADFLYESFNGVEPLGYGNISSYNQQELWAGKKGDLYDVYHRYELIYEDALSMPHLLVDDYTKDYFNYRYAQVLTEDGFKVYDILDKCFLNFTSEDAISSVHSDKRLVITSRTLAYTSRNTMNHKYTLLDFDGKILATMTSEYYLHFTEQPDLFSSLKDGKRGILKLVNGKFEEVIPPKYRKITQVFSDKIVALNTQNCVKIVHFEKQMKKGVETWVNKLDKFKLGKDVVAGFFLEDESEGILTLSNGFKVLLSLYLQGNDEKYHCEDIVYEGNAIFRCYQCHGYACNGTDTAKITFMCNGQAVNANANINKTDGIALKLEENGVKSYYILTPDGKKIKVESPIEPTYSTKYSTGCENVDFLTIPKDGRQNIGHIHSLSMFTKSKICNLINGEVMDYSYSPVQVWHNIYVNEDQMYRKRMKMIRVTNEATNDIIKFSEFCAGFNEYAVFKSGRSVYVIDRQMNLTKYENANVTVDEIFQLCIVSQEDKAIVVSNNGVEEFPSVGRTIAINNSNLKNIYKSKTSGNYVLGNIFVNANMIKYEASNGTIDAKFASLL